MNQKEQKRPNWGFIYSRLIKFANPGKQGLTSSEKAVLEAIADHMGRKKVAWPGFGTLTHFSGLSRRTVIRTVQKLQERGYLQRMAGSGADSNHYEIDAHAVARLITKTKYHERAEKLLARLSQRSVTSVTATPPQCQDDTTTSVTVTPTNVTVTPELPRNVPTRTRSKNSPPGESDLRSGQGGRGDLRSEGGGRDRLSDYIKNHEVEAILCSVEATLANTLAHSTRPVESVAGSVVKLFKEVKEEAGRYPSPEEVVDSIGDPVFRGLRNLSFGFLTGSKKREEFKTQLLRRVRNTRLAANLNAPNAADAHDIRVEELKRETAIQFRKPAPANLPIPEADYHRLPPWLKEKVRHEWNEPEVPGWVAAELAKPAKEVPVPLDPVPDEEQEKPLGYEYGTYDIEQQLFAVLR